MNKPNAQKRRRSRRAPIQIHDNHIIAGGDVTIVGILGDASALADRSTVSARTRTIAAIKADCMNRLGDAVYYRDFARVEFGTACLGELTDEELHRVKLFVMGAAR